MEWGLGSYCAVPMWGSMQIGADRLPGAQTQLAGSEPLDICHLSELRSICLVRPKAQRTGILVGAIKYSLYRILEVHPQHGSTKHNIDCSSHGHLLPLLFTKWRELIQVWVLKQEPLPWRKISARPGQGRLAYKNFRPPCPRLEP